LWAFSLFGYGLQRPFPTTPDRYSKCLFHCPQKQELRPNKQWDWQKQKRSCFDKSPHLRVLPPIKLNRGVGRQFLHSRQPHEPLRPKIFPNPFQNLPHWVPRVLPNWSQRLPAHIFVHFPPYEEKKAIFFSFPFLFTLQI